MPSMPESDPAAVIANLRKEWVLGSIINRIPFAQTRMRLYERLSGITFESLDDTLLLRGVEIMDPDKLTLGKGTVINRHVVLDSRGGLTIGRDVGIAERSVVITGAHGFEGGITDHCWHGRIEDKVFINLGAMIMPGVIIGEGAVVAAGAIVTKDVEPWTIVAGIPAKKIADRTPCDYELYRAGSAGGIKTNWR